MRLRSACSGAFVALILGAALGGCANSSLFDSNNHWFSRPLDITGRNSGYTFSELQEAHENQGPVAANDLVSASGACPSPEAAAPAPAAVAPGSGPLALGAGDSPAAQVSAAPSLLGGGIALGMTECEVVWRAGAPSSVQIGSKPNGDRTAALTFDGGPRAGIYHFERGRLMDMDSLQASAPAASPRMAKRIRKEPARAEQISTE